MTPVAYDEDFFEWAVRSAELIRSGQLANLDLEHIAEEIEDLAKRDRREAGSRLTVVVKHLLKWRMQPERRETATWLSTLNTQRGILELVLEDSPSLQRYLAQELQKRYLRAREEALQETRLPNYPLEALCPFTLDEVLNHKFFPS